MSSEPSFIRRMLEGVSAAVVGAAVLKGLGALLAIVASAVLGGLDIALVAGGVLGVFTGWWSYWWTRNSYGAMGQIQQIRDGATMVVLFTSAAAVATFAVALIVTAIAETVAHGFRIQQTSGALLHVVIGSAITWLGVPVGAWLGFKRGFRP